MSTALATSPSLPQNNPVEIRVPFGNTAWQLPSEASANELCERLIDHVLDCDICLSIIPDLTCSSDECAKYCSEYRSIQQQIAEQGRPLSGQILAI